LPTYPDGNRWQIVALHFEARPLSGGLQTGDETSELKYFTPAEAEYLSMDELDRRRVTDSFAQHTAAVVCDDFITSNSHTHHAIRITQGRPHEDS
jgi:hypothetical protein